MPWVAPSSCLFDRVGPEALVVVADPPRAIARSRHLLSEEEELANALSTTWAAEPRVGEGNPRLYQSLRGSTGGSVAS